MRRLSVLLALVPAIAHAEVMDKEFALSTLLLANVVGAVLVFVAARLKPVWLVLIIPLGALLFWAHVSELVDPFVGPEMVREGGPVYVAASWIAPITLVLACLGGVLLRRKKGRAGES